MQHLTDNAHIIVETFKENPIFAVLVSIVGLASGYAIGECHLPLMLMQLFQIIVWTLTSLAASIPVISAIKNQLIPWLKSFKKK